MKIGLFIYSLLLNVTLCASLSEADVFRSVAQIKDESNHPYKRKQIAEARFGVGEQKRYLDVAYKIGSVIGSKIIGQERAISGLQEKVIQYIESFGTRTRDPVAIHYIGLPGIGKSALTDELKKMGFPMVRIDAQNLHHNKKTSRY